MELCVLILIMDTTWTHLIFPGSVSNLCKPEPVKVNWEIQF